MESALSTFFQIHDEKESGDVLIFLPGTTFSFPMSLYIYRYAGQENIEGLASTIQLYAKQRQSDSLKARIFEFAALAPSYRPQILVRPLYAALPVSKQLLAFSPAPPNTRKCVLATNIAETSVTIPGIKFVIDCGVCNEKKYIAQSKGSGSSRFHLL